MNPAHDDSDKPRRYDLAFYTDPNSSIFDEQLAVLEHLGICYMGTDGFTGWNDSARVARHASIIEKRGMKAVSVHASIGIIDPQGNVERCLADNKTIIDQAACWGASSTVWHCRWLRGRVGESDGNWSPANRMDAFTPDQLDALAMLVLPEMCAYAADKDVWINLENIWFTKPGDWAATPLEIIRFVRDQNLPHLGFILDSGHAWLNDDDPVSAIREAGVMLKDTHFVDGLGSRGFRGDHRQFSHSDLVRGLDLHLIPGLGTINWVEVIHALWEIDFPGPIVFEGPHIKGHPDKSIAQWQRCVELTIQMWRAFEEAAMYWPHTAARQ